MTSQGHHYGPGTCYSDYISYSHDDNSWGDLLTEIDGTDITYDEIGNPENWRNATSLTWEGRNLVGATVNGTEFVFKYDSDGIRARKEYASIYVDYITDGTKILCENRYGVNFRSYYYDASGSPIGLSHGGDIYSFKKNSQGDCHRSCGFYCFHHPAYGKLFVSFSTPETALRLQSIRRGEINCRGKRFCLGYR